MCAQCHRPNLSRGTMSSVRVSRGTRSSTLLVVIVLLGLVAKVLAELPFDECRVICDRNSRDQQPQTCNSQCQGYKEHLRIQQQQLTQTNGAGAPDRDLQQTVDYLLAVTGVTLALTVVVLILMVMMFFNIPRKGATKFALASFLKKQRKKENVDRIVYHKGKSPGTRKKTGSPNGLISTISTSTKEESSASQPTEDSLNHHSLPFGMSAVRTRQPSESTCPEEPPEGYDNLGLSTTTLTSPSSDFGPAVSTVTLNTTLNDHEPHQLREVVTSSHTRND